ncbi:hypothetical protein L7F22_001284 [Adiantum nelumboides]|nr:hypothetical protein [Adiantum nelumboides]
MAARHRLCTLLLRSVRNESRYSTGFEASAAVHGDLEQRIAKAACGNRCFIAQATKDCRSPAKQLSSLGLRSSRFSSSSSFAEDDLPGREDPACERDSLRWDTEQQKKQQYLPTPSSSSPPAMLLPSSNSNPVQDQEPYMIPEEPSSLPPPAPFGEPTDIYIPVKAFFISRRINLKSLQDEQFLGTIASRNHLILKWKDRPPGFPPATGKFDMQGITTWSSTRYIVVFSYGAVVLFNFGDNEEFECLDVIRQHGSEQCLEAKKDGECFVMMAKIYNH